MDKSKWQNMKTPEQKMLEALEKSEDGGGFTEEELAEGASAGGGKRRLAGRLQQCHHAALPPQLRRLLRCEPRGELAG